MDEGVVSKPTAQVGVLVHADSDDAPPRRPGRPRSAEAQLAIVRATLELLLEQGYRAMTVEQVRARAGVGKATIYRRWSSKEELVKEAVKHLHAELPQPPDTGSLQGDFVEVARLTLDGTAPSAVASFLPRLMAEASDHPELHAIFITYLVEPRRRALISILHRAIERGEVREDLDLDLVVDMLAGPLLYRAMLVGTQPETDDERPREVLTLLLEGLARRR